MFDNTVYYAIKRNSCRNRLLIQYISIHIECQDCQILNILVKLLFNQTLEVAFSVRLFLHELSRK